MVTTTRLTEAQRTLAGTWYARVAARARGTYRRAYRALDDADFDSAVHLAVVKAACRFRSDAGGVSPARYALYQVRGELREALRSLRPRGYRRTVDAPPLDLPLAGDFVFR